MDKNKIHDIATQLTVALIIAGHVPPGMKGGIITAADMANDLYDEVFKRLNESLPSR